MPGVVKPLCKSLISNVCFHEGQLDFLFSSFKLSEILKFGLDKLLSSEGSTMDEIDLESILGETKDGQWISGALPTAEERSREQEEGSKWGVRAEPMARPPQART